MIRARGLYAAASIGGSLIFEKLKTWDKFVARKTRFVLIDTSRGLGVYLGLMIIVVMVVVTQRGDGCGGNTMPITAARSFFIIVRVSEFRSSPTSGHRRWILPKSDSTESERRSHCDRPRCTRGPNFPLSRLKSRLTCLACGSRRVTLFFEPLSNAQVGSG